MEQMIDQFLSQALQVQDASGVIALPQILVTLILSIVLSLSIAYLYRSTHRGVSYSQSYAHTLVLLGVIVAVIMMIVGSNIARAFSLVGALSIIRFRTALKETRDMGFIFLVIAAGMAVGTQFYALAVLSTLVIAAVIVTMYKFNLYSKDDVDRILRVRLPADIDHQTAFSPVFGRFVDENRLVSMEAVSGGVLHELVYSVVLKKGAEPQQMIEALRQVNENQKVALVMGYQEVDL
jgi:hypothetical protein